MGQINKARFGELAFYTFETSYVFLPNIVQTIVYMYINRFRFNFLSYRKVGLEVVSWKCGKEDIKDENLMITAPELGIWLPRAC